MLSIGLIMLLASISPGPDFAVVSRYSIFGPRGLGLYASFGVALGVMLHAFFAAFGIASIITSTPLVFFLFKYCGGAYLIYMGISALKSRQISSSDAVVTIGAEKLTALKSGFLCNALNPKSILFVFTLFTQIIPPQASILIKFGYSVEMFLIVLCWFILVSLLLDNPFFKKILLNLQKQVMLIIGSIFILLGIRFFII